MQRENPLALLERVLWVILERVWFVYPQLTSSIDLRIVHTKEYVRQINKHTPLHGQSFTITYTIIYHTTILINMSKA